MTRLNHFVFTGNTLYSQRDVSNWTTDDWLKSGSKGIYYEGECAIITGNTLKNLRRGMIISGDKILISHNEIDYYVDDGIDFTSGNTVISHNRVINHCGKCKDGNHNDGIQGWTVDGKANKNVTIDSNLILESTGKYPEIPLLPTAIEPDGIQGMFISDGRWENVTVTNNVVGAAYFHGMTLCGFSNSIVANNTVVKQSNNAKITPQLGVNESGDKIPVDNVIVRNNIAHRFNLSPVGVVQDHNISLSMPQTNSRELGRFSIGSPRKMFVNYDLKKGPFDLTLREDSFAIGRGNPEGAPAFDILGRKRDKKVVDAGAYMYEKPKKNTEEESVKTDPRKALIKGRSDSAKPTK
jgi:hypothetical protein